jgi:hypothetical protein
MANPPPRARLRRRRPTLLGALTALAVGFMLAGAVSALLTVADFANALPRQGEPPVVILPPTLVYGTAELYGPRGCVAAGAITTTVVGRNIADVTFIRDGRRVKRVQSDTLGRRRFALVTRIAAADLRVHTVRVRVRFVEGAIPTGKTMRHRFVQCRAPEALG